MHTQCQKVLQTFMLYRNLLFPSMIFFSPANRSSSAAAPSQQRRKKIPVSRGLQHQFVKRCATLKKSWFFSVNFFISISILWTEWGLNVLRKRTFFEYLGTPQIQIGCPAFRHQINKRLKVRFFWIISFRTSLNTLRLRENKNSCDLHWSH